MGMQHLSDMRWKINNNSIQNNLQLFFINRMAMFRKDRTII